MSADRGEGEGEGRAGTAAFEPFDDLPSTD